MFGGAFTESLRSWRRRRASTAWAGSAPMCALCCPFLAVLIATIAIFNFTGTWNSYLVPSTFISTLEKFVLVVGLQTVNNEHFQQENLTLAGVFLLSFPVIIFFMFTQKFFVQGIATSGIKS